MPDVSLPPVGELVQITTVDGWSAVGCRTGALPWVHAVGRPPVKCEDIASRCRVLVLPDADGTRETMTAAAAEQMLMLDKHLALLPEPLALDVARQFAESGLAAALEAVRGGGYPMSNP